MSVESPEYLWRLDELGEIPAAVRFVAAEPLLTPLDFSPWFGGVDASDTRCDRPLLHLIIIGGESGPGARPCDLEWIRSIVEQCQAAEVPVFVKQLGSQPYYEREVGSAKGGCPVLLRLKDRKGGDPSEWPEELRVREFPREEIA